MGVLLVVLFPILLLGSSGALGFWSWTFFAGLFFSDQSKRGDDDWLKGIALASSIPVVAAAAVLAGRSSEFASSFGESFMEFLWLWCACAFVVGLLFGWRFSGSAANVPLRFFSGVAIGWAAGATTAIMAAWMLLMPPAYMWRWIQSKGDLVGRLERVFNPDAELVALRNSSAQCSSDRDKQKKRADDLEFRAMAEDKSKAGSPKIVSKGIKEAETCTRELDSLTGIQVRSGQASRQVGGRIYIGVTGTNYVGHWCDVSITTDIKPPQGKKLMRANEIIKVETSMGPFRLLLTKAPTALGSEVCEFDLVRD